MDFIHQPRQNETVIRSEARGFRSREVITLKQSEDIYEAGTPVVAEYVASDPQEPTVLDEATGLYVRAKDSGIENIAAGERKVAFVRLRVNASKGDVDVAAIVRHAEIEGRKTDLGDLSTAEGDAFAAAAETQGLVVR